VEAMKVVGAIDGISFVYFDDRDVVRHKLVQQIVKAYEKFSNGLDTFNPKLAVKWQVVDWLALRGTAGTTFRAPTAGQVDPGCAVGVANLGGQYRAVQTCGNPDLQPETADAYNVGFIVEKGGFNLTVDYFLFKFKDELTT